VGGTTIRLPAFAAERDAKVIWASCAEAVLKGEGILAWRLAKLRQKVEDLLAGSAFPEKGPA
jgi:hypothetical protein